MKKEKISKDYAEILIGQLVLLESIKRVHGHLLPEQEKKRKQIKKKLNRAVV